MKTKITLKELIAVFDNVTLYYHGNSYKETLNYCFTDQLNQLKRLGRKTELNNVEKQQAIYLINELLYNAYVLGNDLKRTDLKGVQTVEL